MPARHARKYGPLHAYLQAVTEDHLTLGFTEIEALIGAALPRGARGRQWWENARSQPQARAWWQAGWQTWDVDLRAQRVTFVRQSPETPA
jgi:hypothetical protein